MKPFLLMFNARVRTDMQAAAAKFGDCGTTAAAAPARAKVIYCRPGLLFFLILAAAAAAAVDGFVL